MGAVTMLVDPFNSCKCSNSGFQYGLVWINTSNNSAQTEFVGAII